MGVSLLRGPAPTRKATGFPSKLPKRGSRKNRHIPVDPRRYCLLDLPTLKFAKCDTSPCLRVWVELVLVSAWLLGSSFGGIFWLVGWLVGWLFGWLVDW